MPASTIQLLESGLIPECPSPDAAPDYYPGIQRASRIASPGGKVACTGSGRCISIQDITSLHIEGQRETVYGPEYLCVGKMWLKADAGVPSDLLQFYRGGRPRGSPCDPENAEVNEDE
jgi:hypothetical protein